MKWTGRLLGAVWSAATVIGAIATPAFAQGNPVTAELVQKTSQANFAEFFDMLSLPNDAVVPEDIRKNADWMETAFKKRGFATRQFANAGKPLVFADYGHKFPNVRPSLARMHLYPFDATHEEFARIVFHPLRRW